MKTNARLFCFSLAHALPLWVAASAAFASPLPTLLAPARQPGQYLLRGPEFTLELSAHHLHLRSPRSTSTLRWHGARPAARLRGETLAPTLLHDLRGSDSTAWRQNLPAFTTARARQLYSGIDLVYHSRAGALEFDLELTPHADAAQIQFSLPGAILSPDGDLQLPGGFTWKRPVASQGRTPVPVAYTARGPGRFGFTLGAYNRSQPLLIDPVLSYASYLGGSLTDDARAIAVDAAGNSYLIGSSLSPDYAGTTRGQTLGSQDIVVTKLNPAGTAILWATYLGGQSFDTGLAIAVDAQGNVYGAGSTASTNFPVSANAPQRTLGGGSGITDGVIFRLNPDGSALAWATFLGGSLSDLVRGLAVDPAGAVYVTGRTDSTDFPNTSRETLPARGGGDAFVTKLNATGTAFVYSLLLGGFALDTGNGIALDAAGAAFVAGESRSENFPVTDGALQTARRGGADAFVARVRPDGSGLAYSTYYGGEAQEAANAIAVDAAGNAYFTGLTYSSQLPLTPQAYQRLSTQGPDAFVAKLNPSGAALLYSTYLGGDNEDVGLTIAVNRQGEAYIGGQTNSPNFPVRNDGPLLSTALAGGFDGFLAKMNFGGTALIFATHFGGAGADALHSIALESGGRIWGAGSTESANLPATPGAPASRLSGATDGFVVRYAELTVQVTPATVTLGAGDTQQFVAEVTNTSNPAVRWNIFPPLGTISPTGLYTAPASFTGSSLVTVSAVSQADGTKISEAIITLVQRVQVAVTPAAVTLLANQTQQFTATVQGAASTAVTWSLSPATGEISAAGLYRAPAVIAAPATVTVRAASVADPQRTATATITLSPPVAPPAPQISIAGVANAASFRPVAEQGGLAPGQLVTFFGQNMGPAALAGLRLDSAGLVANSLAGTRVLFDGAAAPLIYTSAGQLTAVVPYSVDGRVTTQVQVEFEGRRSNTIALPVVNAAPALFTADSSGRGPGAILNQNGAPNAAANPAARNSVVVVYLTGEGVTNPAGVDGKPAAAPLPVPRLPVAVSIGGFDAPVLYAGGAPGLVAGVMQVNVRIPAGVPSGPQPIVVNVGSASSRPDVTLAVQ